MRSGGPLDLLLMGPPGAGKGTQGRLLGEALGVPWVSSGDLLRHAVEDGSALGDEARGVMSRGELVPDRLIVGLMSRRLEKPDARGGFIADGYPRTVPQAEALDAALDALGRRLTAALAISLPDDDVVDRLTGRRTCPACGRVYHVKHEPPARAERCDVDGARLIQREDDSPATIRRRLAVYHQDSEPLIAHYGERGLLREVDGTGAPAVVAERLYAASTAGA
jgi:adenylate kinase